MERQKRALVASESPNKKLKYSPSQKKDDSLELLFEDSGFDLINNDKENSDGNSQETKKGQELDLTSWTRCIVEKVEPVKSNGDLILLLRESRTSDQTPRQTVCRLQHNWTHSKIKNGALVSIRAEWSVKFQCFVVDSENGYLVTDPDCLLSGTSVVGALFCRRKGIFQSKFCGIESDNRIMTVGSLVHELLQRVLMKEAKTSLEISNVFQEFINCSDVLYALYGSKMTFEEGKEDIGSFIPHIVDFIAKYKSTTMSQPVGDDCFQGKIDEIQDIEENVFVPQLGLKGKIDISASVRIRDKPFLNRKLMPIEVKTGKPSFSLEHKGQLILYQMMLSEIGRTVDSGLLLYLKNSVMKEILPTRNEKRDLIMLRNELAHFMCVDVSGKLNEQKSNSDLSISKLEFPETISHRNACSKCPYNIICSTYYIRESPEARRDQQYFENIATECTSHLETSHINYFIHWSVILFIDDKRSRKNNNTSLMWIERPESREEKKRAIRHLKFAALVSCKNGKYRHKLVRNNFDVVPFDFLLSGFQIEEYVILSTASRFFIASGRITEILDRSISIEIERNLFNNYRDDDIIVDKYEFSQGNYNFSNLGALLDNTEAASRIRSIVIDKKEPVFKSLLPLSIRAHLPLLDDLNQIQKTTVLKAFATDDYMLIKGFPGTGKTKTIVAIIQLAVVLKKTVLVTSHTHSAVDNILLRLLDFGIPFLRLGSDSRIKDEILPYSESTVTASCKSVRDLKQAYSKYSVVGVTCIGANHSIFNYRKFDLCIVDEATQVYQPTILKPLFYASKFILAGDPNQLSPIVRSNEAKALNAEESLFERLDSPIATRELSWQYRMNKTIMKLANELTYENKLICGNPIIGQRSLHLSEKDKMKTKWSKQRWLLRALETHIDQAVVLLDTMHCFEIHYEFAKQFETSIVRDEENNTIETDKKYRYINFCDVVITFLLIRALLEGGLCLSSIGVMAPFRAQVDLLKKIQERLIKSHNQDLIKPDFTNLEINTVDQYQGRDKDVIIYSCTRTELDESLDIKSKENEILEDHRRLTVAITRAKNKLIMIGDQNYLNRYTPFKNLFSKIPSLCKLVLAEGKQGFSWNAALDEFKNLL